MMKVFIIVIVFFCSCNLEKTQIRINYPKDFFLNETESSVQKKYFKKLELFDNPNRNSDKYYVFRDTLFNNQVFSNVLLTFSEDKLVEFHCEYFGSDISELEKYYERLFFNKNCGSKNCLTKGEKKSFYKDSVFLYPEQSIQRGIIGVYNFSSR